MWRIHADAQPVGRAESGRGIADADHPAVAVRIAVSGTQRDPGPDARPHRQADPKPTPVAFSRAEQYLIDGVVPAGDVLC